MGLHKGQTNNRHGRPKGSENRVTQALRPLIRDFVQSELEDLDEIVKKLEPKDRVTLMVKLIDYIIPHADANTEINELEPQYQESSYIQMITSQIIKVEEDLKWKLEQEQALLSQSKSLPPFPT